MMQLVYEPAFEPLHGMFRSLRLQASVVLEVRLSIDLFRILDFYLLFPERLIDVRLRPEHIRQKNKARRFGPRIPPYGPRPDDQTLLRRMEPFQIAAQQSLVLHGYLDASAFEDGWIQRGSGKIPFPVYDQIEKVNQEEKDLLDFLHIFTTKYIFEGINGIKARTGLMEYRYDAI